MSISLGVKLSQSTAGWTRDTFIHANESASNQNLSMTAVAVGFLFSFRAALAMITARWLNIGTEPGVIAGFLV